MMWLNPAAYAPGSVNENRAPSWEASAAARGIDPGQFRDEYNDPIHYRPELPSSNRSHTEELKTGEYFGP